MKSRLQHPYVQAGVVFTLGCVVGFLFCFLQHNKNPPLFGAEERFQGSSYKYISPLLACGDQGFSHLGNAEITKLEGDLKAYLEREKSAGNITDAGIYYRQLYGGPWLGVNFEATFTPGSLLKVPLALSIYKKAERVPAFLEQRVLYERPQTTLVEHFTSEMIEPGKTYSVEELVRAMLVHSDNEATLLLTSLIADDELLASYAELGVKKPTFGADYEVSVRTYASFFRILYNATYISPEHSERLLEMLSSSSFKAGIAAGAKTGTPVSNKFGEREIAGSGAVQLHDCGIVYKENMPYILCVMTRGHSYDALPKVIAEISHLVFEATKR